MSNTSTTQKFYYIALLVKENDIMFRKLVCNKFQKSIDTMYITCLKHSSRNK